MRLKLVGKRVRFTETVHLLNEWSRSGSHVLEVFFFFKERANMHDANPGQKFPARVV